MSTVASRVAAVARLAAGLLAAGLLAAAPLAAQARADSAADIAAIQELARRFSAAYVRGDAAAMADLYTPDAVIFPERSEAIAGRDAIRRYWTLDPGRRITHHELAPAAVVVDGDHAYDHGLFEVAGENDGKAWGPSGGKYVV
ncbi:MAG TPA: SgcJ/EcaC family oxidoreductase, partial [Gemmatimonadales bacterium]|nr:SgcJ/EcaC family oxidoreductase [Gemmatimonadales bacterium]